MVAVAQWALRCRDRLVALSVLDQDALLYLLAGALALGTLILGEAADYREWAQLAVGPYALGAVVCFLAARRRSRQRGSRETNAAVTAFAAG